MQVYDFVDLELKIDDTVTKFVNLFTGENITDVKIAKNKIKISLINNPNSYIDYHDIIFDTISLLLSKSSANDFDSFCETFLASTFLLEKFIQCGDNDDIIGRIGDFIHELFCYFQLKGNV